MSARQIVGLVLVVLVGIVALQNTQEIVLRAFFWRVTMPQLGAVLGAAAVGFAAGVIVSRVKR